MTWRVWRRSLRTTAVSELVCYISLLLMRISSRFLKLFFVQQDQNFFERGITKLPERWRKMIEQNGQYINWALCFSWKIPLDILLLSIFLFSFQLYFRFYQFYHFNLLPYLLFFIFYQFFHILPLLSTFYQLFTLSVIFHILPIFYLICYFFRFYQFYRFYLLSYLLVFHILFSNSLSLSLFLSLCWEISNSSSYSSHSSF